MRTPTPTTVDQITAGKMKISERLARLDADRERIATNRRAIEFCCPPVPPFWCAPITQSLCPGAPHQPVTKRGLGRSLARICLASRYSHSIGGELLAIEGVSRPRIRQLQGVVDDFTRANLVPNRQARRRCRWPRRLRGRGIVIPDETKTNSLPCQHGLGHT